MRTSAAPLLPLFRSRLQGDLLARLLPDSTVELSLTALAEAIGASIAAVQREVDRLEESGIVSSRGIGRSRLVRTDSTSPYYEPLTTLVTLAFGPPVVLAEELAEVGGVAAAYLFGSWAARFLGHEGPHPADIDVLVVGDPNRDEVHDAALRAEHRLGRPVNVTIRSASSWDADEDGFVRQVKISPLVPVVGRQRERELL